VKPMNEIQNVKRCAGNFVRPSVSVMNLDLFIVPLSDLRVLGGVTVETGREIRIKLEC
jgi:hypothetical protein